ncbi:MAG: zinc carboxypeptidase, partial [Bacteroidales bacterium]|nr:zinc carboxypeptidase [Bacteroidales bacterium]
MKKTLLLTVLVFWASFAFMQSQNSFDELFSKNGEIYFKFEINTIKDLPDITKIISIDNRDSNTIFAYANQKEFEEFTKTGYDYTILPHPNENFNPKMATWDELKASKAWDTYPTYEAYVAMMQQFKIDYPDICDVFSIGNSVDGRNLLVAKISDNINSDENEPEFFYTSTMHGDETAGYIFMLRLIDSLLTSYGSAP